MKIPITKIFFNKLEIESVEEILSSGWLVQGDKVKEFEKRIVEFTGAKYAIATTSCTTALHLSLATADIRPGDEVIVPSFTFAASANVVENFFAKPVFVDIDPRTFNIDPLKIEKAITKKTKAIMPVHLFGLSSDMKPIMKIAKKYNLFIVEDAACALGTKYRGKHVGNFGNTGCFSFHPRKPITSGEGGMVITNSKKLAKKMLSLRDHGAVVSDFDRHIKNTFDLPDHEFAGFNYRMTNIQGAIGVEQIKKLSFILRERRKRADVYTNCFKNNNFLLSPYIPEYSNHTYQSYVLRVKDGYSRERLVKRLTELGISLRPGTQSVPHLKYYRKKYGYNNLDFIESLKAQNQTLTIPLFASMSKNEQNYIIKNINNLCVE